MFEFKRVLFLLMPILLFSCAVDFSNKTDIGGTWVRFSKSVQNENVREELTIDLSREKFKNAEGKVDKTVIPGKFTWIILLTGKQIKSFLFREAYRFRKQILPSLLFLPMNR